MSVARLQCSFGADTPLARDRFVINPVFNNTGGVFTDTDWDSLCSDLAAALNGWRGGGPREIKVTAYEVEGPGPHRPMGSATVNAGVFPESPAPREVALCLSFYSGFNEPRRRGRLYIPNALIGGASSVRPSGVFMTQAGALAPILADLGGVDVDWSVYSKADGEARAVSNWWVDDEWDTIRSRGLRSTSRIAGSVDE